MNVTQIVMAGASSTVKDVIIAAAAIATAAAAWVGLGTWRRELPWRAEYDMARRVLKATYAVLGAIQDIRHPFIYVREFEASAEKRGQTYDPKQREADYDRYVYEDRWKLLQDALIDLEAEVAEAQVFWGLEFRSVTKPIRRCVGELRYHLSYYLEHRDKPQKGAEGIRKFNEAHDVVYSASDDPDKDAFLRKLRDAVAAVETEVRPFLGRRGHARSR